MAWLGRYFEELWWLEKTLILGQNCPCLKRLK